MYGVLCSKTKLPFVIALYRSRLLSLALPTVSVMLIICTLTTQSVVLAWAAPLSLLEMQIPRPCPRPAESESAFWQDPQVTHFHRRAWGKLFCITAVACSPATLHPSFSSVPFFLKRRSSDIIVLLPWEDIRVLLFNKAPWCFLLRTQIGKPF